MSQFDIEGLLLTETAGKWATGVEAKLPTNASYFAGIGTNYDGPSSVSCWSPGNCVAVGTYLTNPGGPIAGTGVVLTETNGSWDTGMQTSLPGNAASGYSQLDVVSCPAAGDCTAVGGYPGSQSEQGFLLTESSGTWGAAVEAPLPGNADVSNSYDLAQLSSVSCSSPGNCAAEGIYSDTNAKSHVVLLSEVSGAWGTAVDGGVLASGHLAVPPGAVSCTAAGDCTAIASNTNGLMWTETSGSWGARVKPNWPAAATNNRFLRSVSCASPGNCMAFGDYFDGNVTSGALFKESSGKWAASIPAKLPPKGVGVASSLYEGEINPSVSCTSSGYCAAVDSYNVGSSYQGLLLDNGAQLPVLSDLRLSPRNLKLRGRRVRHRCVKATHRDRKHHLCTRPIRLDVSYRMNVAASVIVRIHHVVSGRSVNGRCVKATHKNRKHHRCTHSVAVPGSLKLNAARGLNHFTFTGRIGRHRLGSGRYRLTATPAAGGLTGRPRTGTFKISH